MSSKNKKNTTFNYLGITASNGEQPRKSDNRIPEKKDKEINYTGGVNNDFSYFVVEDSVYTKEQVGSNTSRFYFNETDGYYYKKIYKYIPGNTYRILVTSDKAGIIPQLIFNSTDIRNARVYEASGKWFVYFLTLDEVNIEATKKEENNKQQLTPLPDLTVKAEDGIIGGSVPNNEIRYTSTNNNTVSHTGIHEDFNTDSYCDGLGIATYKEDLTYIGYEMFYDCSGLVSVILPNTVTEIGEYAFYNCTSLKSITIPDSVTSIGNDAFEDCSSLESITIPDSVTYISDYAFYGCKSLKSITIPSSVTSISNSAFSGCSNLESIVVESGNTIYDSRDNCNALIFSSSNQLLFGCKNTVIPNSVTSIGDQAFSGCSGLTSITIPNSVTEIGNNIFDSCSNLESIVVDDENNNYDSRYNCNAIIRTSDNVLIAGCKNTVIPDSVTSIGENAFSNCTSLESITIPDSVTYISDYAFWYCTSLTSITIPSSITYIGYGLFGGCSSLETIVVESGNTIYDSRYNCNAIIKTSDNVLITGCKNTTIPSTITSIDYDAFCGCTGLTSIEIPSSVTFIGYYAFYNCASLTSITIPESVTEINCGAFYNCTSLTSITIPESVASIGDSAFSNCTSLESITIPESVASIGDSAFWDCTSLESITIPESVTEINWGAFYGCYASNIIHNTTVSNSKSIFIKPEYGFTNNYYSGKVICTDGEYETWYIKGIKTDGSEKYLSECSTYWWEPFIGYDSIEFCSFAKGMSENDAIIADYYLKTIIFPAATEWMPLYVLASKLETIVCKAPEPPDMSEADLVIPSITSIYVPSESVDTYKMATGWSEYADIIKPIPVTPETIIEEINGSEEGAATSGKTEDELVDEINEGSTAPSEEEIKLANEINDTDEGVSTTSTADELADELIDSEI